MPLLLALLLSFCFVQECAARPSVVITGRSAGMFSCFNDVLSLLKMYDLSIYGGAEVNFGKNGLYYDPEKGPNWWEYYCEPIGLGVRTGKKTHTCGLWIPHFGTRIEMRNFNRAEAYKLIKKYIQVKKHIRKIVANFVRENFTEHHVITVHYRGTDKVLEAPRVGYKKVADTVKELAEENIDKPLKIFVATDETAFLNFMIEKFGHRVCSYSAIRSDGNAPVHKTQAHQYKMGEDAIVDCLILSRGKVLVRTSSNLSLWSTYFNPNLRVVDLNQRYRL